MPDDIPRLLPNEPLPPYTFIPGHAPHPVSDPTGHSFGRIQAAAAPLDLEHWIENHDYLRGLDLFNHGFYWEAHEAWEGLWHAAGRTGTTAMFLKGLIKLAAGGVKHLEAKPAGVLSHASRASELWHTISESLQGQPVFLGLRIASLISLADSIAVKGWPASSPLLQPSTTP
jgi:hypothetical protein